MTDAAAMSGTIHALRDLPSRKLCQLVVEFPIEHHAEVARRFPHMSRVAVARLTEGKEGEAPEDRNEPARHDTPPRLESNASAGAERGHKSPAQIAGYLCTQVAFQKFLKEKFPEQWRISLACMGEQSDDFGRDLAADTVRQLCNVDSRADIKPNSTEWLSLMLAWKLWNKEAEVVPA